MPVGPECLGAGLPGRTIPSSSRSLTCYTEDVALGDSTAVLGQGALRTGAEQEVAIRGDNQAGDGSVVTPAPHGNGHGLNPRNPARIQEP